MMRSISGRHSTGASGGEDEEDIADPEQVLSVLKNTFFPRWESFKERQPLKEVAQFGKDIQELGETHHSRNLMNYGRSVQDYIERFDIENMRETLWTFPEQIERLEAYTDNSIRSDNP